MMPCTPLVVWDGFSSGEQQQVLTGMKTQTRAETLCPAQQGWVGDGISTPQCGEEVEGERWQKV